MNPTGKGGFTKGKSGNPAGRPKKEREVRYAEIMQVACSFKDWREICDKAIKQAKQGDATARKWLADYLVGVPKQKMEISGIDGKQIEIKVGMDVNKL